MIKKIIFAASLIIPATMASAAITPTFSQGTLGFQVGEIQVADFDTTTGGAVLTGPGTGYYTGLVPDVAAPPAGDTTRYLAVLNGGSASFAFTAARSISFDVGSVDDFNKITLTLLGLGGPVVLNGADINGSSANGNQFSPLTNGRLTLSGSAGEAFTGLVLSSTGNSFEIDNLGIRSAVPESTTWAMFLIGFGSLGVASRRRRAVASASLD